MANPLPPLVAELIAKTDGFQAGMTRASMEAKKASDSIETSFGSIKTAVGGLLAGLGALKVVTEFQNFVAGAAAMDDLAEKTGASVEKLSALAGVAKISGVSIDVVEGALTKLAKGLSSTDDESQGAGKALAVLGLKAQDLARLDTADALKAVADKLNEYKDGAGKTALAIALLGKSGAQALPYLKDLAETEKLVGKLTAEQAAQAENLEKNYVRLAASTSGAWKEFAAGVLPTVDQFVGALLKVQNETGGVRDKIRDLTNDGSIARWAELGALGLAGLGDTFQLIKKLAIEVATPIERLGKNVETVGALAGIATSGSLKEKQEALAQLKKENEAFYKSLDARLVENRGPVTLYADRLKAQFAAARAALNGQEEDHGMWGNKPRLNFNSGSDKAGRRTGEDTAKMIALQWKQVGETIDAEQQRLIDEGKVYLDQVQKDNEESAKAIAEQWRQVYAEIDAAQERDIEQGRQYLASLADDTKETTKFARDLGLTFSSAFEDAIVKGQEFSDVLQGLAQDLLRIVVRKSITEPLGDSISGFIKDALPGGLFSRGATATGGASLWDSITSMLPKFATGTDYVPHDMVAMVHKGERIVPAAENRNDGSGGVSVNIINNGPPVQARAQAPRIDGGRLVVDVILNAARTDGNFRDALRSSMGAPA